MAAATYSGRLIDSLMALVQKAETTRQDPARTTANSSPLTIDEVIEQSGIRPGSKFPS
jgi:hypothetical protein